MALGGHRDEQRRVLAAQAVDRDPDIVVEVVEQLDALASLVLVEALEQPLCFPVRHGGAGPYAGGVRSRTENHEHMIVLGIDPGLANTGYGVVARRGGRLVALDGGCIETSAAMAAERRLAVIHERICALLDEHAPDAVALEELYFGANARSAFAVGQARGV